MQLQTIRIICLLALAGPASAFQQRVGFNVAFQEASQIAVPPPSYSAALFQSGVWNRQESQFVWGQSWFSGPLVDVNNNMSSVELEYDLWYLWSTHRDHPLTTGVDEVLLDSCFTIDDPGGEIFIHGLAPGDYSMYSYVVDPIGFPGVRRMSVKNHHIYLPGSSFPGDFVEGQTHVIHHFNVTQGEVIPIEFSFSIGWEPVQLQGIQIIPDAALLKSHYCDSPVNSTGVMANMALIGSSSIQANNLRLGVRDLPPNQFGYFIVSQTASPGVTPPGSQGNLCIGGNVGRHNRAGEVLFSGTSGFVLMDIDLGDVPQPQGPVAVMPGESWNWQFWFRDNNPQNTSNFSDAYRIGFVN